MRLSRDGAHAAPAWAGIALAPGAAPLTLHPPAGVPRGGAPPLRPLSDPHRSPGAMRPGGGAEAGWEPLALALDARRDVLGRLPGPGGQPPLEGAVPVAGASLGRQGLGC